MEFDWSTSVNVRKKKKKPNKNCKRENNANETKRESKGLEVDPRGLNWRKSNSM